MRVLHIISSLKIGGAERALCNFLAKRVEQGHEHYVAYFHEGPCVETLRALKVPLFHIQGWLYRYDIGAYLQLLRLINRIKPDILHTSLWAGNVLGRLLARHCSIPIICELHGNTVDEGKVRNFIDKHTVHLASTLVAVSESVKTTYANTIITALPLIKQNAVQQRLTVIKNGIDYTNLHTINRIHPLQRADIDIDAHAFVVGAVGRLEPIKSYDLLIRAFALLYHKSNIPSRPLKLCIVGDGSQTVQLKNMALTLGINHAVSFVGMRSDAFRFYPLFDCFVLSSQSEGLSLALLEALSCAIPVVTTHAEPTHEAIVHGVHGLLVPPNNPGLLAAALRQLYCDQPLHSAMKKATQDIVKELFTIERVVQQYQQLYNHLMANNQP